MRYRGWRGTIVVPHPEIDWTMLLTNDVATPAREIVGD
jgi:hypothetical protein